MEKEFSLYGLTVRTNNKYEFEMRNEGKIAKLWGQFFAENITAKVPAPVGDEVIAVYSNYESDHNGDYDYTIGLKSSSDKTIPGLVSLKVSGGRYISLKTEKGPIYAVVPQLWQKVWQMNDQELGGKRAYDTDYEIYGSEARNPESAVIELKLGLE